MVDTVVANTTVSQTVMPLPTSQTSQAVVVIGVLAAGAAWLVLVATPLETTAAISSPPRLKPLQVQGHEYGDRAPAQKLVQQFQQLCAQWKLESGHLSSASAMAILPAYQRIIGMGAPAVPMVLEQLRSEGNQPDHWFWALHALTGEDPVPAADRGDVRAMARAWLNWGDVQGYLS